MAINFPSKLGAIENFEVYRMENFERMIAAKEMDFKYGQNIKLNFDFDLSQSMDGKVSTIVRGFGADILFGAENLPSDFLRKELNGSKLDYFHNAFFNDVLVVRIKDEIDEEIAIERFFDGQVISKVFVFAARDSRARINFVLDSDGSHYCAEDFFLVGGENSFVDLKFIQNSKSENFFGRRIYELRDNSIMKSREFIFGNSNVIWRGEHKMSGMASNAETIVSFLGLPGKVLDINGESLHLAPEGVSRIHTKGVLAGGNVTLTRSLIKIDSSAHLSDGYEKHDVLLLGKAESNAIPNLEINNHNVKCSHGTSSGKISPESLFYLMSRGIGERDAKRELVKGFLGAHGNEMIENKIMEVVG